jgi:hypothetical protein
MANFLMDIRLQKLLNALNYQEDDLFDSLLDRFDSNL